MTTLHFLHLHTTQHLSFLLPHNYSQINIVDYSKQSAKEEHSVEEDVR